MNMRSDRTAAAVIRDVAMDSFAERGFAGTTVRDLAGAAGVSPALVLHHYGSKEGLRAAVDAYAAQLLVDALSDAVGPNGPATLAAGSASGAAPSEEPLSVATTSLVAVLDAHPRLLSYLRRGLVDGGPTAAELFRTLYDATTRAFDELTAAGVVRPSHDPATRVAFLLANDLASIVLRDQIAAVLGTDPLSGDGLARWTQTLVDVYTKGVFASRGDDQP